MRTLAAFALLLLFGVQANAQLGGASVPTNQGRGQQVQPDPENQGQIELLELEQETDKTLLKEAMLTLGRKELEASLQRPTDNAAERREVEQREALRSFIAKKKDAILKRSAEMKSLREEPLRQMRLQAAKQVASRNAQMTKEERQEQIERMESSQAENQLLQRQLQAYGQKLTESIESLVNAELTAGKDETQRGAAEEARKQYEKAKAKYVEVSKQAVLEQNKLNELQQKVGMGGMGGMGGGFR